MKKLALILLILAMLTAVGCGKQPAVEAAEPTSAPTVPETVAPDSEPDPTVPETEPVPQTVDAVVQTDHAPAILLLLRFNHLK